MQHMSSPRSQLFNSIQIISSSIMSLNQTLIKRLTLLKYQKPQYVNIAEREEFIDLVKFLLGKYGDDQHSKQVVQDTSDQWEELLIKYLKNIKSPLTIVDTQQLNDEKEKEKVLDWLTMISVKVFYKSNADQIHETKYKCLQKMKLKNFDCSQEDLKESITKLATLFNIPSGGDLTQLLHSIIRIAERKFVGLPELKDDKNIEQDNTDNNNNNNTTSTTSTTSTAKPNPIPAITVVTSKGGKVNDEVYPLGFDLHNDKMNTVATILRLLYVSDLKEVQNKINEVLALVQTYTADPQTNFKLGVVGR
ncbi:hypothetical protein DFA_01050 [Cavenderia fasciculata]|uniref:Uncharacterized protein n=1 Tax=Cavenderia fasciculata TaxID=261658 RepID=F4PQK8_CACFS|nr:uncharacterized protein DFA_01050 [Cavenderia fasciculata]EGG21175.1 hypothetical protein DFA_01050 [Cavenderia fasciculata]|eukprot:XP_004359025.1 hypothetical protein DFA_01050 [Cavenderia fasciculata]